MLILGPTNAANATQQSCGRPIRGYLEMKADWLAGWLAARILLVRSGRDFAGWVAACSTAANSRGSGFRWLAAWLLDHPSSQWSSWLLDRRLFARVGFPLAGWLAREGRVSAGWLPGCSTIREGRVSTGWLVKSPAANS